MLTKAQQIVISPHFYCTCTDFFSSERGETKLFSVQYLHVMINYFLNLKCMAACSCYIAAAQHSAGYRYSAMYNVWLLIFQGYKSGNGDCGTRLGHCYINPLLRTLGITDTK